MPSATRPVRDVPKFGADFTVSPTPKQTPSKDALHVLVIGAGVAGTLTAWLLLDKGYKVTIVSKEFPTFKDANRLGSQVAGALWEFPSAGCGPQVSPENLSFVRRLALDSYEVYSALAKKRSTATEFGVKLETLISYFPVPISSHKGEQERLSAIEKAGLHDFKHDPSVLETHGAGSTGAKDAFQHLAPIIDGDVALGFLTKLLQSKGAQFVSDRIWGNLRKNEAALLEKYKADIIVNASGLGARELAGDENVYPTLGGLLRVINDGTDFPKINNALVLNPADHTDFDIPFIVPRNDSILIIGTFSLFDTWSHDLTVYSPAIQIAREKAEKLVPALKNARLDPEYPIAQALRPMRKGDVRIEREDGSRIVHSYGHGVSGWTLGFGSAFETLSLIEQVAASIPKAN